ncbi:RND family efflux transporter, MFP subunit [Izhakiella capsodis]|uniref:RND family efflux transporter, MFP subunit n=1 Tax=Izhakiella capsodis TaxID=1367852 RepID=A0A1I4WTB0_9GAMM|nr:efflux RND transporter periplasmic adaptor subunit [Izhakiella capsodis]SFN16695.1 RND family efflux transporter, MFP subunit [Izhakiella capsodis]
MKLSRPKPLIIISLILAAFLLYFFIFRHSNNAAPANKTAAPLVSLTQVKSVSVPLIFSTQGHVVTLNQADIQPQVDGTVKSVAFKEGDFVKQGQLLFTLNDSTQQASLRHANATFAESHALLVKAQQDLARGRDLKARHYISASDWDTLKSAVQQYSAQSNAAEQDIRTAAVQLGYTRIYAPVSGKTGALNVHTGSLVQPGSSLPMVTINQFDPIGVSFTLPEADLNAVLSAQSKDPVKVWVKNARGEAVAGDLNFINNAVSTNTGTISFKAQFSNSNNLLWPGTYKVVHIDAGSQNAVVLPPQAVQNGPQGQFVYLVDSADKAFTRPVKLLRIQQGMAIVQGVTVGENVVVEGGNNLWPGMSVKVVGKAMTVGQN